MTGHGLTETHDGDRDFWEIVVLRATVSARNLNTGEIRESHFANHGSTAKGEYANISAALRAIGNTIDRDRA